MNNIKKLSIKKLKYTSYEIVSLVKKSIEECGGIDQIIKKFDISKEILSDILNCPKILTYKMYEVSGKILNKTIRELTDIETEEIIPDFRKLKKCQGNEVFDDIEFANMIFDEIIINERINID